MALPPVTTPHAAVAQLESQSHHPPMAADTTITAWKGRRGPELAPLERMLSEVFVEALDGSAGGARWVNLLGWLGKLAMEGPLPDLEVEDGQVAHYVERTLQHIDSRGMAGAPLETALSAAFPTAVARVRTAGGPSSFASALVTRDRIERRRPSPQFTPRARAAANRTAAEIQFRRLRAAALRRGRHYEDGAGAATEDDPDALTIGPPDFPTHAEYAGNVPVDMVGQWPQTVHDVLQYIGCRRVVPTNADFVFLTRVGPHP